MNKTLKNIPTITLVKKFFIEVSGEAKVNLLTEQSFGKKKVSLSFSQTDKVCKHILKVNGKVVFINTIEKNKNRSIEEMYDVYETLPFVKAVLENKENQILSDNEKIDNLLEDCSVEFGEFIGDSFAEDYTKMSKTELKNFISRIFTKKGEIKRLRALNKKIQGYEEKIKDYKKLPPELLKLAVANKGTIGKLEKAIILKARRLVLGFRIHSEETDKTYINEFLNRSFPPENKALAEMRGIPNSKNFIALIRIQLNKVNKGHKGVTNYDQALKLHEYRTLSKGQLELELGWEYEDIIAYIYTDILENVYFFDAKKEVLLDTYVFMSITNALQKLKNITGLKDEKGATRASRKETKVIKKIQRAKYELEAEGIPINLGNVKERIEIFNDKVGHGSNKVREKDVEKYYDNVVHQKYNDMSFQGDDETESKANDSMLKEMWEDTQEGTEFDPAGHYRKKEVQSQINTVLKKIVKTDKERLVLDFILENLLGGKPKMKVDVDEFNSFYSGKLGFEELKQKEVDNIMMDVIAKITVNRNEFRLYTNIDI